MTFENSDFIMLVKRTREQFGISIEEAHELIFADKEMRRLVAWRINHDAECRRLAIRDLARRRMSHFICDGDRISFKERASS